MVRMTKANNSIKLFANHNANLKRNAPWYSQLRSERPKDHIPHDLRRIVVILERVLHKTEAVHIANVRFAVRPQQIETADRLLEC